MNVTDLPAFEDGVELGEVIASRELEFERDGVRLPVFARIGRPRLLREPDVFICPYRIDGMARQPVKYSVAIDEIQAMQGASVMLGGELVALARRYGGRLTWLGQEDLGFPDRVGSGA